ncbi:hypothetical protein DH2020_006020 [Rehmannia glutinosa]|uniref:SET domain-containing protein n=1 Tax=Rehmannia glutinosa TaxID=99300 RepID=A0ABR0XHT0_REHGL
MIGRNARGCYEISHPPVNRNIGCNVEASHIDEDCNDFLPWLEHKAGADISSALAIGKSSYGRTLYAAEYIQTGDCILKKHSAKRLKFKKEFLAVKSAFDQFPDQCLDVTFQEFSYAYGLVTSRAWESSRGVSMIPFADFLNHDGTSDAYVLSNESKKHSEVIADHDFAPGDEVLIRYGKFSNATLLLDFGFTVSCNSYDQVQVELNVPQHDRLYKQKMELLDSHRTPNVKNVNEFTSSRNSFTIREVRTGSRKGKGIPQSLRAFCRILTCNSQHELNALAIEAAQNDGRLARYPLKDKNREVAAHCHLLSEISRLSEEHNQYIKFLLVPTPPCACGKSVLRRRLAQDLLAGELRVLKSASAWLENYCSTLWTN